MHNNNAHTFHIPVMGLGYTIDTPIKVASYGISSVISLVDDLLMEQLREKYSIEFNLPFSAISSKMEDFRAKRISSYLNMVDDIVKEKVENLKKSVHEAGGEFEKYIKLLPAHSPIKKRFKLAQKSKQLKEDFSAWVHQHLPIGEIDVNIMTKLDQVHYKNGEALNNEQNDAHTALRGFAESKLHSSVVFSAGMNPKLFTYLEKFKDFFPNGNGELKKKVILKVSDFRSALVQGKIFANKGIWVSEYRIESGVNCGGHAFPSNGVLIGPVLEEFKNNRASLLETCKAAYTAALEKKALPTPKEEPTIQITAQGGVGTAEEHQFLMDHYQIDTVGWGSPFLLAPDVVSIDKVTLNVLKEAGENDLYFSQASPLGVAFNNIRQPEYEALKAERLKAGKPGFPCVKQYLKYNTEFTEKPICTASQSYQKMKLEQLKAQNLTPETLQKETERLLTKECLCVGLGVSTLRAHGVKPAFDGPTSVCPGPNIAYYSEELNLEKMCEHIYGRASYLNTEDRPHMFIKELSMYKDILKEKKANLREGDKKGAREIQKFETNLASGIAYYKDLGLLA